MSKFVCRCVPAGQPSPHRNYRECSRNRSATASYMRAVTQQGISEAIARSQKTAQDTPTDTAAAPEPSDPST